MRPLKIGISGVRQHDIDAIGLTNLVTRLNHGGDIGGQPIGAAAPANLARDHRLEL